jgi:predicted glycoside hydrolase/deacetylase ChbG (UPF0249 family)
VSRVLIVNADDFGRSRGINRGVVHAHVHGVVTSASAMVRWPAAEEAADLAREHPLLSVGLHVDLSEWAYRDDEWQVVYEIAADDRAAVRAEVDAQLERFLALFGRPPTHLDSHQHVHRQEPVRSVLVEAGGRLSVAVRDFAPGIVYRGDFYGQTGKGEPYPEGIALESLLRIVSSLPEGVTELGCHPAAEPELASSYATERVEELHVLCDSRLKQVLVEEGISLRSFAQVAAERRLPTPE